MIKLMLAFQDGQAQEALKAAVKAVEDMNQASVYRAWVEEVKCQHLWEAPSTMKMPGIEITQRCRICGLVRRV